MGREVISKVERDGDRAVFTVDIPLSVSGDVLVRVTRARLRIAVTAWNHHVLRPTVTPEALIGYVSDSLPYASEPSHAQANALIRAMLPTWPYQVVRVASSDAGRPLVRRGDRGDGFRGKFHKSDHMADSTVEPLAVVVCGLEMGPHPAVMPLAPSAGSYADGFAAGYAAGVAAGLKQLRASFADVSHGDAYHGRDGIAGGRQDTD